MRAEPASGGTPPYFGILVLDKPAGATSHDLVAFVRRVLGGAKAGHCGTLDPAATGVLPICLGKATRLAEYLSGGRKEYRAKVFLDRRTSTGDLEGTEEARFQPELRPDRSALEAVVQQFRGPQMQKPHRISAVRVEGRRLYERARNGASGPEPAARPVTIHRLEIEGYDWPRLRIVVECSAGTYIRQLAEDLGARLGVGGCLESLVRTRVDGMRIEEATTPFELASLAATGRVSERLRSPAEALATFAQARLVAGAEQRVRTGQPLLSGDFEGLPEQLGEGELVKVLSSAGDMVAIYRATEGRRLHPCKVLI